MPSLCRSTTNFFHFSILLLLYLQVTIAEDSVCTRYWCRPSPPPAPTSVYYSIPLPVLTLVSHSIPPPASTSVYYSIPPPVSTSVYYSIPPPVSTSVYYPIPPPVSMSVYYSIPPPVSTSVYYSTPPPASTLVSHSRSLPAPTSVYQPRPSSGNPGVLFKTTAGVDISPYQQEIKCYSLPYGVLGFISHILTYYTSTMIACGLKPLSWKPMEERPRSRRNNFLAAGQLIMTITSAIYTMVHCSHSWQFETTATMKLALSITVGLNTIKPNPIWGILYIPGAIIGLAGGISLASSDFILDMRLIAEIFGGVTLVVVIFCAIIFYTLGDSACYQDVGGTSFHILISIPVFVVLTIVVLAALYSDWVLAIVGNNLVGYPYGSSKATKFLLIIYWIGKRLPMFVG